MTTFYVAKTGNDTTGDGLTLGTAKLTLQAGIGLFTSPGDVLRIGPGTYAESIYYGINVNIPSGSSWSAPITLVRNTPADVVTVQSLHTQASGLRVFNFGGTQQYIILDGLVLDAVNMDYDVVQIEGTANHIRITNCELKNALGDLNPTSPNGSGIGLHGPNCEILNTSIHDCGTNNYDHGIYCSSASNRIDGCTIYTCSGYGIHGYNSAWPTFTSHDNIFANNIVHDCVTTGILVATGSDNLVYNNVCYGSPAGIRAYDGSTNAKIYNNTCTGNSWYGITIEVSGIRDGKPRDVTGTAATNNIVYGNGVEGIHQSGDTGTVLVNNLSSDPVFVNAATHDYHLEPTSPAINAGLNMSSDFTTDIEGVPRTVWDIGAYEYIAPPSAVKRVSDYRMVGVLQTMTSEDLVYVMQNISSGKYSSRVAPYLGPMVMTTTQRDAMTPVNGMIIYNSTTGKFQGRAAGAWVDLH